MGFYPFQIRIHLEQPTVAGLPAIFANGLGGDQRCGFVCHVHHLTTGVLNLPLTSKGNGENFAVGFTAHQKHGRVFHGNLTADVAVHPFHRCFFVRHGALGDQVVHIAGPVLNGGIPHPRTFLSDNFHNRAVKRIGGVNGCRTAFHVVNKTAFVGNNQGAFKLPHIFGINSEIGLQRNVHFHTGRDVNKTSTRPHRTVERGEFVILRRNHRTEVFFYQIRVFPNCRFRVNKNNAFLFQFFTNVVVNHFGIVLRPHTGQEFAFRFRNSQAVEGFFNVFRHIVPAAHLLVCRFHVVINIIKIQCGQIRPPVGHGLFHENFQRPQPKLPHPFRLLLVLRNLHYHFFAQPFAGFKYCSFRIVKSVFIFIGTNAQINVG